MKNVIALLTVLLTASCAQNEFKTGQRFYKDSPVFYLSIAPSFSQPKEYEIKKDVLLVREYTGAGSYEWGRGHEIQQTKVSEAQREKIRELSVTAIKDALAKEQAGIDVIVLDGISWYLLSDYGPGPFISAKTNNPPNSFYDLQAYIEELLASE